MNREWQRGNICLLKRPLADLISVVEKVDNGKGELVVRCIDSLPGQVGMTVKEDMVLYLAREQERELPEDFLGAIERQRKIIFTEKKAKEKIGRLVKEIQKEGEKGDKVLKDILKMLE